jgi:hypothetical protein
MFQPVAIKQESGPTANENITHAVILSLRAGPLGVTARKHTAALREPNFYA